jgi:hypothetical protein
MTFPRVGPAHQTTGNVAGGPYGAWSGTGTTALIGPAGVLVPFGAVLGVYDGTHLISSGTVVLSDSNGVSFGISGQTITASAAGGGVNLYDGTNSITSGTAYFSDANGVSFGINGQTVTASIAAVGGAQTGISSIADSVNTQTVGMLSFANGSGVTFGLSTGAATATLTASVAAQSVQTQTAGNLAQTGFATTTTNGVVIVGTNQGGVTLAVPPYITTYVAQTVQAAITGIADGAGTQTTGLLSFANSNGLTFGLSTGAASATLTGSYTVPSTAGLISGMRLSAGAGTSNTAVSGLTFANSNGFTFGLSTGASVGTITASYTVPTQTNQSLSAIVSSNTVGNTSAMTFDARSVSLQGYGIVSVGLSTTNTGSSILFSATQSNQAVSAQGGSSAFQTLVFTNSNNVSFSNTGGSVWGSYALNVSAAGGTSNALSGLTYSNLNGVSFGLSTGAGVGTLTASVAAQTSTGLNVSAGAGTSNNLTGITFANSNSITFGLSTGASVGTITASVAYPAQTNQTIGFYALSNTTSSVSSGTFDARSMSINAIGPLSVGYSQGSIVLSAATVAGQTSAGMYFTGNTVSSSSTTLPMSSWLWNASGAMSLGVTNGSILFSMPQTSSLVGVGPLSVSTNGSTISIYQNPVSTYVPLWPASTSSLLLAPLGQTSANPVFFPYQIDEYISFDMVAMLQSYSYVTSSSAASLTQAVQFGIFSNNASTWSLISSSVSSVAMTNSGVSGTVSYATATSTSGYGYSTIGFSSTATGESLIGSVGLRNPIMQFGGVMSLTPGWYAIGLLSTNKSSSANVGINQALIGNVVLMSNMFGMGQSTTVTNQMLGMGYGTATTASLPSSMAFSNMTNSLGIIPIITLAST